MASARIKKKRAKMNATPIEKVDYLNKKISQLQSIRPEKMSKTQVKQYRSLTEMRAALHPHSGRRKSISDNVELGALIDKYWDYVDKGLIKPRSNMEYYDQSVYNETASWMKNEILSESELKSTIEKADEWKKITSEKRYNRLKEGLAESAKFINW